MRRIWVGLHVLVVVTIGTSTAASADPAKVLTLPTSGITLDTSGIDETWIVAESTAVEDRITRKAPGPPLSVTVMRLMSGGRNVPCTMLRDLTVKSFAKAEPVKPETTTIEGRSVEIAAGGRLVAYCRVEANNDLIGFQVLAPYGSTVTVADTHKIASVFLGVQSVPKNTANKVEITDLAFSFDFRDSAERWKVMGSIPDPKGGNAFILQRSVPASPQLGALLIRWRPDDKVPQTGRLAREPDACNEILVQSATTAKLDMTSEIFKGTGYIVAKRQDMYAACRAAPDGSKYLLNVNVIGGTITADDAADIVRAFFNYEGGIAFGSATTASAPTPPPPPTTPEPESQPEPARDTGGGDSSSNDDDRGFDLDTEYSVEYRGGADATKTNGLEGALVARAEIEKFTGTWFGSFHAALGAGQGGGVVYDFGAGFGLQFRLGRSAGISLSGGVSYDGVSDGKIEGGWVFPIGLRMFISAGPSVTVIASAAVRMVPDVMSRGDGSANAPFGDELEAFAGFRIPNTRIVVGGTYREQLTTSFFGGMITISR